MALNDVVDSKYKIVREEEGGGGEWESSHGRGVGKKE